MSIAIPISAEMAEDIEAFQTWWRPFMQEARVVMLEVLRLDAIGPHHRPDERDIGPEHGPGRCELRQVERFRRAVRDARGRPTGPASWRARP